MIVSSILIWYIASGPAIHCTD